MIEVDVFWAWAIGGSIAYASYGSLRRSKDPYVNAYFLANVLYLSLLFAPSGAYLLWEHTHWETMFFLDEYDSRDYAHHSPTRSMHGVLPLVFSLTNVLNGLLGFVAVRKALDAGSAFWGAALWNWGYVAMFGILGLGYRRFLYPGTGADWNAGKEYPLLAFFSSRIFYTLLTMGVFLLPPYYYMLCAWPMRGRPAAGTHVARLKSHLSATAAGILVGATLYGTYVAFASVEERVRLSEGAFGPWAPLIGYLAAQFAFGLLVVWPFVYLALSDTTAKGKGKTQ